MAKYVKSRVKLNSVKIKQLEEAAVTALAQATDAVYSDLKNSETIPFAVGTLNDSTFIDLSEVKQGKTYIVSSTPYARRLYYHPEYHFYRGEHRKAGGKWFAPYEEGGKKSGILVNEFIRNYKRITGV